MAALKRGRMAIFPAVQLGEWRQRVFKGATIAGSVLSPSTFAVHPQFVVLEAVCQPAVARWFGFSPSSLSGAQGFVLPSSLGAVSRSTRRPCWPSSRLHKLRAGRFISEEEMAAAIQHSCRTNCVCERVCLCMYFLIRFC